MFCFSPGLKDELSDDMAHLPGVDVLDSMIDAAWFSRPPTGGGVAWEIRYLGGTPFAFVEHLDEDDPEFERSLRRVEARLCEMLAAKESA